MRLLILVLILIIEFPFAFLLLSGTNFDLIFWQEIAKGFLVAFVALGIAVYLIDGLIHKKQQGETFKAINRQNTRFILFLTNRLAFRFLEHLELMDKKELNIVEDESLNIARITLTKNLEGIDSVFCEKLMGSKKKRRLVISALIQSITKECENIKENLDKISPYPHPEVRDKVNQIYVITGAIGAIGEIERAVKKSQKQLKDPAQRITQEQRDLLIKDACVQLRPHIRELCNNIIWLSERAEQEDLFLHL